ncbi:MAG: hemerythrin domain-containing protein [Helicobacteraceae bacterium]|jgi:hemerythrin-like domain-containing protein|nr:hemerythrin domain-containing protein [Helicobacteraceae bacterium]
MSIKGYLSGDHRRCDELFAEIEADFGEAKRRFGEIAHAYERHFEIEERIFFPQFEARSGMECGPTEIMRKEHAQMRALLEQMKEAIASGDKKRFAAIAETFVFLTQQHNSKEESILYPMGDRLFGDEANAIVEAMEQAA